MDSERIRRCLELQAVNGKLAEIQREMDRLAARSAQLQERRLRLRREIQALAESEVR